MFKTLRGRLIAIALIVGVAGWQLYSHKSETGEWLKLGLDLQGGMHLVLEVDDPDSTMTAGTPGPSSSGPISRPCDAPSPITSK